MKEKEQAHKDEMHEKTTKFKNDLEMAKTELANKETELE